MITEAIPGFDISEVEQHGLLEPFDGSLTDRAKKPAQLAIELASIGHVRGANILEKVALEIDQVIKETNQ